MGLFDFGDKAMIKTKAYHVNVGVMQLANELEKSNGILNPTIRGLVFTLKRELNEIIQLSNKLSESDKMSIMIDMNGRSVQFPAFLFTVKLISNDLYNTTGLTLLD